MVFGNIGKSAEALMLQRKIETAIKSHLLYCIMFFENEFVGDSKLD